jgi:hypothetical protein
MRAVLSDLVKQLSLYEAQGTCCYSDEDKLGKARTGASESGSLQTCDENRSKRRDSDPCSLRAALDDGG